MTTVYLSAPSEATDPPKPEPWLLDRLRHSLRAKHYTYQTEQVYVHWVRRYSLHYGKRRMESCRL